jgi:pimeloyl-ACP methyl ester carboxylesterase
MNRTIRSYFKTYSLLSPKNAAKKAFDVFQQVRMKQIREREQAFFHESTHFQVNVELRDGQMESIDCYRMGDETQPTVLLVHGWDSNAGSMYAIAKALIASDHSVILFNLPGHAFYESTATNLLECRNAFMGVMRHLDAQLPVSVISHSFGSAVVTNGLANLPYAMEKAIFLTNPNRMEDIFTEFQQQIGLSDKAFQHLINQTERMIDGPLSKLSVENNIQQADISALLLIHDRHDKVLSYQNAQAVEKVHANAQLLTLENVGHYRMLWNESVVKACVDFINN